MGGVAVGGPMRSREGWNHNAHYHDLLLAAVPSPCPRALDVGCGLGAFARRLAPLAGMVDAIDRDPATIDRARTASESIANVRFTVADFLSWPGHEAYDYVSMIAVLHHMPFEAALGRAAELLRPGGTLAVLGLPSDGPPWAKAARAAVALPVSRLLRWWKGPAPTGAPIAAPSMALGEIRREAARLLPGAVVRSHLLWRYSIVWTRPPEGDAGIIPAGRSGVARP